ncbi:MAG: hypothetical protein E6Q97_09520 [Desulfurellales bacterium]|nr:MAG: hypothetical protein E6Q97_09520 [Desulfurellales bacterium]
MFGQIHSVTHLAAAIAGAAAYRVEALREQARRNREALDAALVDATARQLRAVEMLTRPTHSAVQLLRAVGALGRPAQ